MSYDDESIEDGSSSESYALSDGEGTERFKPKNVATRDYIFVNTKGNSFPRSDKCWKRWSSDIYIDKVQSKRMEMAPNLKWDALIWVGWFRQSTAQSYST